MSYGFGLTIELMVAILLLLTILYCARLNKQIGRLKADERLMKTTVADLMMATETRRARHCRPEDDREGGRQLRSGARLREAEGYCASHGDNLRAGEELLNRLRKIAYANNLLGGDVPAERPVQAAPAPQTPPPPALEPVPDAKSVAAAAQAFADRARARAQAHVSGKAA